MGHIRKQMITFLTSARCNLSCTYCAQPGFTGLRPEHERLDPDFADAGLGDFFASNPSRWIRFFGAGEPTTAFETMAEVRELAFRRAGAELRVELQSNGLFSEAVGDWIETNVDILWISYDGPADIQDRNRPTRAGGGSSRAVRRSLDRFARHPKIQTGVRATVEPRDFGRLPEILEHFRELGLRRICLAPVYASTANDAWAEAHGLLAFARAFADAWDLAPSLGQELSTHLIVNFDEPVAGYCRACTPCPHLTTDGYVTCCDETPLGPDYLPGILQELVYGRWDPKAGCIRYDEQALARIRARNTDNLRRLGCAGCEVVDNCSGGCIPKNMFMSGSLYTPFAEWCQAVRYLAGRIPRNRGLFPFLHS